MGDSEEGGNSLACWGETGGVEDGDDADNGEPVLIVLMEVSILCRYSFVIRWRNNTSSCFS